MSESQIRKLLYGTGLIPVEFDGIKKQAGLNRLNQIALHPMKRLTTNPHLPRLPDGDGR